jgi:hypothetical protein
MAFSPNSIKAAWKSGISALQGGHDPPQKFSTTGLPWGRMSETNSALRSSMPSVSVEPYTVNPKFSSPVTELTIPNSIRATMAVRTAPPSIQPLYFWMKLRPAVVRDGALAVLVEAMASPY